MDRVKNIVEPGDDGDTMANKLIDDDKNRHMGNKGVNEFTTEAFGATHDAVEGLHFLQDKLRTQTESVRKAFRMIDLNMSGNLSPSEFRRVLDNFCYKMNDKEFSTLMDTIDTNHDGHVSYEEFMQKIGCEIIREGP